MKIYRIVHEKYKDDLSGEGARLYGGRWNKQGDALLYFSEHLSLCALEVLVHLDTQFLSNDFYFMEAEIPDSLLSILKHPDKIIPSWNSLTLKAGSQQYGSDWVHSNKSLCLSVPSVIIPQERNILINPNHASFTELKVIQVTPLVFDPRTTS